ncbi:hypothetical protein BMR1_02g02355 [Babesia microti strain RI]|uniref:Thioesterase domain-containing protein n=1 Tax=Babesia microti (strain RI) TaxID=1133968 RepID=A0A1R4AAH9_BABMR|nr:hypothetical protein BMR1_02g02355 [Babesia microti strain RI]SJK85990.1 hypothetical protein BMR1_02g02355 [Babesia microti strain RI]|eukprot:XP_012648238.2 hypothetical protein BMR1_02g02355 [Babesia microti strain RI]
MISINPTIRILRALPLLINSVAIRNCSPSPTNFLKKSMLSTLPSMAMNPIKYEQFGMGTDAKDFPTWCHQYFKYQSYSELRMLPMESYTNNKFGHLINDSLMGKNGFRIRCFISDIPQSVGDSEISENKGINVTGKIPPEGINNYREFVTLRTCATQLIFLVDVGTHCCGHNGVWHGGITSAILDNTFGLLGSLYLPLAATKSLNIKFISPILVDTPVIVSAEYDPDSSSVNDRPGTITADANVYLPSGKLAATGRCEIVDVSKKWNTTRQ